MISREIAKIRKILGYFRKTNNSFKLGYACLNQDKADEIKKNLSEEELSSVVFTNESQK